MSILQIENLKIHLRSAAFLVARPGKAEEAHRKILQCFLIVENLGQGDEGKREQFPVGSTPASQSNSSTDQRKEIAKVESRLRLWAWRPHQINCQILTAFLKAKREGVSCVTEEEIRTRVPDPNTFKANFAQMKIIAPKNHGKVFEHFGQAVTVWEPVEAYVKQFEESVFQG